VVHLDKYLHRSERQIAKWDALRASLEDGAPMGIERSAEYGADIIRACETGEPFRFNGNVRNHGLIDNLPADCCVEVPCVAGAGSSRSPSARCPAISPRSCTPTSTSRA
jgi:alpha-galactosidase